MTKRVLCGIIKNRTNVLLFVRSIDFIYEKVEEREYMQFNFKVENKILTPLDGEYTVKRIELGDGRLRLMPANENNPVYQPIEVTEDNNFMVWGVVTYVIKKM